MMRLLRALVVVALTVLLIDSFVEVRAYAQQQIEPDSSADSADEAPTEDEAQPSDEPEENADAVEEEPPPSTVPQPRRAVAPPPPRTAPTGRQRVQPATPAQIQPQMPARARVRPSPPGQTQAQDANGLPPLEDLTATRERPLFSSTRRPPEVETAEEPSGPITENASMPFELVGIVLGADVSVAIFRNTESKEETRVAKGEMIGNWSVDEIVDRAVVLRGNNKRVRMRMFNEANAPGIQVGRVSGEDDPAAEAPAATEDDANVDEDIAPSSSPEVRPATAKPKPPPSLQNKNRPGKAARPPRPDQRARRQQRQQP